MCKKSALIGILFAAERITEGVVGFTLSQVPERLGRRQSALLFLGINLVAQTVIIFCPGYFSRLLGFVLYGIGNIKNSVMYVWLFELVQTKNKAAAVTFLNAFDSSVMVQFGLYVIFVSRHWFYIELVAYSLAIASFMVIWRVIPESPKWLLINGRTMEAHQKFRTIAALNGVKCGIPEDAVFVEQAIAGQLPPEEIDVFNVSISRVNEMLAHSNQNVT
jgi:MFS family permease